MSQNYTIPNNTESRTIAWLITDKGDIFIKNKKQHMNLLTASDLTVQATNEKTLLNRIWHEWGFICPLSQLHKIYSLDRSLNVYITYINYKSNITSSILSKNIGKFINYSDLDTYIDTYIRPEEKAVDFLEAFIAVISYLDEKHSDQISEYL